MSKLLVTGGAGFIGSVFVRMSLDTDPSARIVNPISSPMRETGRTSIQWPAMRGTGSSAAISAMPHCSRPFLAVVITRVSNNYGPYHFPEKLIPLMISNALEDRQLPVYGDGMQVRDWLFVEDHCRGIRAVLEQGREGEIYNIGGNRSLPNLEVVRRILEATGKPESLIRYVTDRPGHDRRYALSSAKLMRETGWEPQVGFEEGLARTVDWYRRNTAWVARVRSGEYLNYYARNYENRQTELRTVSDARGD